jgi:ABC-type multidrug transport system fused ATPase/permease subunit
MSNFFSILRRFLPPYKKYVVLTIVMNLLSTVFSLFSFMAIIPVLQILFGTTEATTQYVSWTWDNSFKEIFNALKDNASYYIEQQIATSSAQTTLLLIGIFLVVMTLLKTGCSYFSSYFVIPIRTGVLRDLRKQLYNKILSLPIGFFNDERKGD